ncbi:GL11085 [Drosophila persimilis]|uniref:GL11085 n=1 Tax=Drosophila persimilis TaxID=7234 RepID=B4GBV8_DROPE|nr:GL11085 [Drosophila persimilis]
MTQWVIKCSPEKGRQHACLHAGGACCSCMQRQHPQQEPFELLNFRKWRPALGGNRFQWANLLGLRRCLREDEEARNADDPRTSCGISGSAYTTEPISGNNVKDVSSIRIGRNGSGIDIDDNY